MLHEYQTPLKSASFLSLQKSSGPLYGKGGAVFYTAAQQRHLCTVPSYHFIYYCRNIFCTVHATSLLFFSVFLKNSKNSSGFLIFQWKRNSICYILYNNSFVLNIVLFLISSISYALCYCPTRVSCCMETSCCTAEGDGAVFRVESGDSYSSFTSLPSTLSYYHSYR